MAETRISRSYSTLRVSDTIIDGTNLTVHGDRNIIAAPYSTVHGKQNSVSGVRAKVYGNDNNVNSDYSKVEGNRNHVTGTNASVRGNRNNVTSDYSKVEGDRNEVAGTNARVYGNDNNVNSDYSKVEGNRNHVTGTNASVRGSLNQVTGAYASVYGSDNDVTGNWSRNNGVRVVDSDSHSNSILAPMGGDTLPEAIVRQHREVAANLANLEQRSQEAVANVLRQYQDSMLLIRRQQPAMPQLLHPVQGQWQQQQPHAAANAIQLTLRGEDEVINENSVNSPCMVCREHKAVVAATCCGKRTTCLGCTRTMYQGRNVGQETCVNCRGVVEHALRIL